MLQALDYDAKSTESICHFIILKDVGEMHLYFSKNLKETGAFKFNLDGRQKRTRIKENFC